MSHAVTVILLINRLAWGVSLCLLRVFGVHVRETLTLLSSMTLEEHCHLLSLGYVDPSQLGLQVIPGLFHKPTHTWVF